MNFYICGERENCSFFEIIKKNYIVFIVWYLFLNMYVMIMVLLEFLYLGSFFGCLFIFIMLNGWEFFFLDVFLYGGFVLELRN